MVVYFDSNIQPSYLKFKKSLYDKNNISSCVKIVSHIFFFPFYTIQYLNTYKVNKLPNEEKKLPIIHNN
jgi:hypothetical protein